MKKNTPKPRIAIDARLFIGKNGGDSTYWTGLILALAKLHLDFAIDLCSDTPCPAAFVLPEDWRWHVIRAKSGRLWSLLNFPLYTKKIRSQIVHGQYNLSPIIGKKGVTTIHDVSFFIGPGWFSKKDLFILQKFVPATAKRSAAIIAVSNTSKTEIETYIPLAKGKTFTTLLAASPLIPLVTKESAEAELHKELKLTKPFLFALGTNWARKNQKLAIEAFLKVSDRIPHQLVLSGKGTNEFPTHPKIILTGYVSENVIAALYSTADLFLFPSLHEGFGIPILESFRAGCPVLCGNGGAIPEIAGNAAIIAPNYTSDTWSELILSTLNARDQGESSNLSELTELGKRRAMEFSWDATAQATVDVYNFALSRK